MTYAQEERKPIPPVEVSQKYMAWNIKEMSESLKIISMALKNIDSNISYIMRAKQQEKQQQRQQQMPAPPKPAPNFPDDMPPF